MKRTRRECHLDVAETASLKSVAVVVVSYNVKHYLRQCLGAVERALDGLDAEVFVVDNDSTDGTIDCLQADFPHVTWVRNSENTGFAKANNTAIRMSRSRYVLLLNPDTVIGEDTIRRSLEWMDSHSDSGALGVKMLKNDGSFAWESRRGVPTPWVSFCKMVGLVRMFPKSRVFGKYYMGYHDKNEAHAIEIVSGAFMMLRRSALEQCGMLDETFFMYGEDIDLSYRLLKSGFRNYYLPTPILHYKGESTQKTSYRYVYSFYNAMLIFFRKHFSYFGWFASVLIRLAIIAKGVLAFLNIHIKKAQTIYKEGVAPNNSKTYAVWGNKADAAEARSILSEEEWLQVEMPPVNGALRNSMSKLTVDSIVVNAERLNYSDILSRMDKTASQGLLCQWFMMYPSRRIMIAAGEIYGDSAAAK